ncbi:hypothetical protein TL16_g04529 [Triparma laevis f. inornata]|uniref:phosphopyruvate hydratase n=1 Tax=Triparma laevis f. inornata TaxID=1714386 RepID=A0A9W7AAT6_9STRA|nr:hypothetical protein TL16_g04529 [Triparma laevis f. inornata]
MHPSPPNPTQIINELVRERPDDPFVDLAQTIEAKSVLANSIVAVRAAEVIGANGLPALEIMIETLKGVFKAGVANMGPFDGEEERFAGKGLTSAVKIVNTVMADKLIGKDPRRQDFIDSMLSEEDFPANAVLAVSIAVCKAGAKFNEMPVYEHVAALANISEPRIPMPWFNLVNGNDFGENELYPKSVSFAITEAESVREVMEAASKIYAQFPKTLVATVIPPVKSPNVGKLGGFAPACENMTDVFNSVKTSTIEAELAQKIVLSVNMGVASYSSILETEEGDDEVQFQYELSKFSGEDAVKIIKSSGEMVDDYYDWLVNNPIVSLEDAFEKKDAGSIIALKEKVESEIERIKEAEDETSPFASDVGGSEGCFLQTVGDDCLGSQDDIVRAEEKQTFNGVTLTMNKAKTVSGFISLWLKADSLGMPIVAVDESEENDPFLVHVAVALRCSQIRLGGLLGGFATKYNELLRLEEGENGIAFIGKDFRK